MDFENYMSPGRKGYLIGIGGVSMSSLAEVLHGAGLSITGSDMSDNQNVIDLEKKTGIKVNIGHNAENIGEDIDFIVRTAAVHDDNPEIIRARELGIPVFERTQAWGSISKNYSNAVCIAGTHGKTTTTSMCTHILMAAAKDPTVMIGGTLPLLNAGHRVGHGNTIIMEACEYYNSFLSLHPTVAVILNIEEDHLDFFSGLEDLQKSFKAFAERTPEGTGCIIANADDANTMEAIKSVNRKVITFGLSDNADVYAENIKFSGANSSFDIMYNGTLYTDVTLHVPGIHNVKNALAAAAAGISVGIRPYAVKYGLSAFNGAGRRFEFKGKYKGADVYDDYAHHPGELKALLDTVEQLKYRRIVLVFQPHTYSRTNALFDSFVKQLSRPDVLLLAEIFAARETNTIGISSKDLADRIDGARFFPNFTELKKSLEKIVQPGDIVLTVGAGDVYKIGEDIVE